jgi:hypothetical protein
MNIYARSAIRILNTWYLETTPLLRVLSVKETRSRGKCPHAALRHPEIFHHLHPHHRDQVVQDAPPPVAVHAIKKMRVRM